MKRLFSLALVLIILSAISVTVFADGTNVTYTLTDGASGFAGGTVTVKNAPAGATDCTLWWGDANGKLTAYSALAQFKLNTSGETVYTVPSPTLIPDEATCLLVYTGKNLVMDATPFATVALPTGRASIEGKTLLGTYAITSDLHVTSTATDSKDQNVVAMLQDLKATLPSCDGLFVAGDTANSGLALEYGAFVTKYIKNNFKGLKYYLAIGNHDTYRGPGNFDTVYADVVKKFSAVMTNDTTINAPTDRVYYDFWKGNAHVIMLGTEAPGINAYLSDTQIAWLKDVLAEGKDKASVTLVFLHQSLYNTIAGSLEGQTWNGVIAGNDALTRFTYSAMQNSRTVRTSEETELINALKGYDGLYLFNGHSHWEMLSEANVYVADGTYPTILNTASVGYLWTSYGNTHSGGVGTDGSQGYYVYLYQDRIVFRGRNFGDGTWHAGATYGFRLTSAPEEETTAQETENTQKTGCGSSLGTVGLICPLLTLTLCKKKRERNDEK